MFKERLRIYMGKEIIFFDRVVVQKSDKYTILHNVNYMSTVKITTELYDFINDLCATGTSLDDVQEMMESEEDYLFFLKYLKKLLKEKIIKYSDTPSEYLDLDIEIDLDITNRCNLRCKHCCVSAGENDDLSTEKLLEIIDKVLAVKPTALVISGGEPLIREDFEEITNKIRMSFGQRLSLMTNGCFINDYMAEFIKDNYDDISISLDGVDEETCSFIRGEGTFEQSLNGIKRLKKVGFENISASMLLTNKTIDKKDVFIRMCKDMGIQPALRKLELIGRAKENLKDYVIHDSPVSDDELLRQVECSKEQIAKGEFDLYACGAGYKQFQIDYRGNIFPCQSLMENELKLGNVLEIDDLNRYIRDREFVNLLGYRNLEKYFPYNFKGCSGCNKQIFCWNCIAQLYRNPKKLAQCDYCKLAFEHFF